MAALAARQQQQPPLTLDCLAYIDMTSLTQSELQALSLCSSSAFDLHRADDIVIPSIDRSSFNESAGSRRQTFSRPRPPSSSSSSAQSHPHHHHHRHRVAGLLPAAKVPPVTDDPERGEDHTIISILKRSLKDLPEFYDIDFDYTPPFPYSAADPEASVAYADGGGGERKRKRGRKPKPKTIADDREKGLQIVNENGLAVDLVLLAGLEDPYREELRRRTDGMCSEEELLEFLRNLGGQWCSRRRKRKIVDASILGQVLPVGWKLLLGLKRKEGRAWIYCRRYISPGGRQFVSCKEVSAYLQSYFGHHDVLQGNNVEQNDHPVASGSQHGGAFLKVDAQGKSAEHTKEVALFGIDNLAEVQIHDLFECHKCNMTFDEKDTYLQHLLSFHQRTTRRYRLGSSVGDGVIVKDGKFECQFCHKVFHERRRYNGHVGIHVRNYVRGIEEPSGRLALQKKIDCPSKDEMAPVRISKMDALIEIAQNSILETSAFPIDEPIGESTRGKQNMVSNQELLTSNSEDEQNSDIPLNGPETACNVTDRTLDQGLLLQSRKLTLTDEKMERIDDASYVVDIKMDSCLDASIMSSAVEKKSNTSHSSVGKDDVEFTADEAEKPGTEMKRDDESLILAPLSDQNVSDVKNNRNLVSAGMPAPLNPKEGINNKNIGFTDENSGLVHDIMPESLQLTSEGDALCKVSESVSVLQSQDVLQTSNSISHKEEVSCGTDQKHENVAALGEMRLHEIEQLEFNLGPGKESLPLQGEVQMNVANNHGIHETYGSSVQLESQEVMLDMASQNQLVTVCVWCGVEFSHEALDSEIQSDSVGYMCPTCKVKISGQTPYN